VAIDNNVDYADIGEVLLDKDKKIDAAFFSDGLHPNAKGYRKVRQNLKQP